MGSWEQKHTGGKGTKCRAIAEGSGATLLAGNHGGIRDNGCLRKAVEWYEQGKVRPYVTKEVPFDVAEVQRAMDEMGAGTINVGKVVIRIRE